MITHFFTAIKLTIVSIIIFIIVYPLLIWGIAQTSINKGNGETVKLNNKVVGYSLEGQNFTKDEFFYSRPSAVAYNAAGSGGSNKGPSNPDYLKDVSSKIDSFLIHNPSVKREQVPAELVTASGSGLDPDISPEGATIQVPRIAKARKLDEEKIKNLINAKLKKPLMGFLGPQRLNVLELNLALLQLK